MTAPLQLHSHAGTPLGALLGDVVRARAAVDRARRLQLTSAIEAGHARHDLVLALEAYTSSLDDLGRPVPYALRDELRLQRSLDDAV